MEKSKNGYLTIIFLNYYLHCGVTSLTILATFTWFENN